MIADSVAAVLEYLVAEVVELSGTAAKDSEFSSTFVKTPPTVNLRSHGDKFLSIGTPDRPAPTVSFIS